MKDICEIVQETLDAAFKNAPPVWLETIMPDGDDLPEEYIIFKLLPGYYTVYANGKPIQRCDYIEVGCYAETATRLNNILQQIERAMVAADFRVNSLPGTDGYNTETGQHGGAMEFSISRTVEGALADGIEP